MAMEQLWLLFEPTTDGAFICYGIVKVVLCLLNRPIYVYQFGSFVETTYRKFLIFFTLFYIGNEEMSRWKRHTILCKQNRLVFQFNALKSDTIISYWKTF